MRNLKLTLAYDGAAYAGWQVQAGHRTLQGALEASLAKVTGQPTRVAASGRTDAGVHALAQVVNFRTTSEMPCAVMQRALNAELPRDMVVREICPAPLRFHARRDAVRKRYRYVIYDGPLAHIFSRQYAWLHPGTLDLPAMQRTAAVLVGKHDFASFQSSGSRRQTTVRTVYELDLQRDLSEPNRLTLEIEADGFLYNMVRTIVGTVALVGRHHRQEDHLAKVLAAKNRQAAGPNAPPHGLFLVRVEYGGCDQVAEATTPLAVES